MKKFRKMFLLLSLRERTQATLLLFMILIMALLDMIGVASILPFVTVITNPSLIETNLILNIMFQTSEIFGVQNNEQFLIALGFLVVVTLIISLIFKALTTYVQLKFIHMREFSIGKRLVEGYLQQSYSWFLSRHSAELAKTILSEINQIIGSGIKPFLDLIAKSMIAIAITVLLFIANPKIALIVSISLGGVYLIIFYIVREHINKIGKDRLKNNELRFMAISETFGAIKEIKVGKLEQIYLNRFSGPARTFAQTTASSQIIGQLPRYILEAITFGGVVLLMLYLMTQTNRFNSVLPIFTLYIFAGYRLMPALQQIYVSMTKLTFVGPSLDKLYKDIENLKLLNFNQEKGTLSFNKSITLNNINYNYPNSSRTALKDINFTIPIKSKVGLVGTTGSGKTTTVDIILGLLEAQKGTLKVDEKVITKKNVGSWQRLIGYVPQNIYLSDDSIAANIAFGEKPENINQETIIKVCKIANLHNFVIDELPQKYQTLIGERGVRLSGGQLQRIGIARALYRNPQVLILDEATSALDNQTEKEVMDAVNSLNKNITIIIIAHRLNTVKNCDIVFRLEKGKLAAQGSFEECMNGINSNLT